MKNLVEALERFFLHKRAVLKAVHKPQQAEVEQADTALRALPVMAGRPSSRPAEAASLRRHTHAMELDEKIRGSHMKNVDVASIARHVGVSRRTVYRYLEMHEPPEPTQIQYTRKKLIEPYQAYLTSRWNDGCRNAQQMYENSAPWATEPQ